MFMHLLYQSVTSISTTFCKLLQLTGHASQTFIYLRNSS